MTIEATEQDIRDGFADVRFDRPVSRIIAAAQRRRTRKRAAFVGIPAVAVIAAGGTALFSTDKVWVGNVTCYDTVDPKALPFASYSPRTTGDSPEELCAKEWKAGWLPFEKYLQRSDAPYPVPPLTACVVGRADEEFATEGAWIGVFPTGDPDFCTTGSVARRMKLAAVPENYAEHMERFVAMSNDAADRVRDAAVAEGGSESEACLNDEGAKTLAADVLADHGYEDWAIHPPLTHDRGDGACWMHINFDNTRKEVTIYSTRRGVDRIWINDAGVFPKG